MGELTTVRSMEVSQGVILGLGCFLLWWLGTCVRRVARQALRATARQSSSSAFPPTRFVSLKMEGLNNGDTAWMAMSCALVLFMTPGLAFFYGGLVRDSNIVNTMMMSIISMGLTTLTWMIFGFSWSFDAWGAGKGFTYVGFRNLDGVWPDTTMPGQVEG